MRPSSVRENGTPKCSSSMTAGIALRHMYSIASWSPSQSDPLTVSYMCQRQSSSPMLPSAAPMPPCAATAHHDDVVGVIDDLVGLGHDWALSGEGDLEDREDAGRGEEEAGEAQ